MWTALFAGLSPPIREILGTPLAALEQHAMEEAKRHFRILIVDDDANARSALAELLRDAGYETSVAGDGKEALVLLESCPCDVLLTDVYLPELSGLFLADRAAAQQPAPHVLFMSAAPPPGHGVWFSKPIDLPSLLAALARLQLPDPG